MSGSIQERKGSKVHEMTTTTSIEEIKFFSRFIILILEENNSKFQVFELSIENIA